MTAAERLVERASLWRVTLDESFETDSSLIAYGRRGDEPVVLKIVKREGDEWHAGETLRAFGGRGVARVYEEAPGALLLERLSPGGSLADLVLAGRDDGATSIIARIIGTMSPASPPVSCPTVHDWGRSFASYTASGNSEIPESLVSRAHTLYVALADSQRGIRLLHGDLQHSNVLFDRDRGWVAIDPKGVIGEVEFEIGAALRNPREIPALVADPAIIERRLDRFASELNVDRRRAMGWGFAQAVLSLIWSIEDGGRVDARDPARLFAESVESMLPRVG